MSNTEAHFATASRVCKPTKRMPVVFFGHGSPMLALEDNAYTKEFERIGHEIIQNYGKPRAILSISAHWFTRDTFIQSAARPEQIYDMYGFPQELYDLVYPAKGSAGLTHAVTEALGEDVSINDSWGIDHGTWSVLVHAFPSADIPVVQLSLKRGLGFQKSYELGCRLAHLRDEGFLIIGSGNIVHNLAAVEWNNPGGSAAAERFNEYVVKALTSEVPQRVIEAPAAPDAFYALPTPDHFLPLVYCLGAAYGAQSKCDEAGADPKNDAKQNSTSDSPNTHDASAHPHIFNNACTMGAIAMTGCTWGM